MENQCPPECPCRFVPPIENPCSCGMYTRGTKCPFCEVVTVGGTTRRQPREQSREAELEEWDRRMRAAVAGTPPVNPPRQRPEGDGSAVAAPRGIATDRPSADSAGVPASSTAEPKATPKKKRRGPPKAGRRTTEQVKRAAERQALEARSRSFWTELGTAVEGQEEHEQEWLEKLNASER